MANPLYDALFARHADKSTPFLHLSGGEIIRHNDFVQMAGRFANTLTQMGLVRGDRVAIQVEKSPQALAIYAACIQAGLVFLPLNTAYTPAEVTYFIENSGAKLFVCRGSKKRKLAEAIQHTGVLLETLNAEGSGTFPAFARRNSGTFEPVDCGPRDLAALLYTSGTTGRSKGAMLTHENLLSNARALVDIWRFSADDVLLHALPIFHTHGLFVATNVTLAAGGSMIFLPKFDVDAMVGNMARATAMMGVPTFYTRLLNDPRFDRDLARHMRVFVSGSAPLLAQTHVQFEQQTGHRILERYGMTETNMNTSNPYDGERRAGTVGFPLPGVELKITDAATGADLPDGDIGVIEVRGPNIFKGYWQMPDKTVEDLRPNGFFITGDLGLIDADGYVQIVGRNKDMIISGGYNIYPKEIESLLNDQPEIVESAVIGVPHPDFGETVIGVVVANGGSTPDFDRITKTIGKTLARYKLPKKLVVVPELPRNTMGKIQKNLLREKHKRDFM